MQRTLAAKDLKTARRGALFGAFLKVWPVLIFLVPGLIGAALEARGVLAIPTRANGEQLANQVFPAMVATLLPAGLRGLVVAALLAALMSSLSSLSNSTLVHVGRLGTLVVVGLGLLWIPVMPLISGGGLYRALAPR